MKKILISVSSLFLFGSALMAQSDAGRTVNTKVIDAMAQVPAANQEQYNRLIEDLKSTGDEGIQLLIGKINPPGNQSNAQVDYALSGLTYYVMVPGQEKAREITAKAYIKALDKVTERETKAFIIRQLQIIGLDESVAPLAAYLNNESLCGPAARALANIKGVNAEKALVDALKNASPACKKDIVNAIATLQVSSAEDALLELLSTDDQDLKKEVIFALSRCGSKKSMDSLAKLAAEAGYVLEKTGANEAYIALIKRVSTQDAVVATDAAKALLKDAQKAQANHTRIAAMDILLMLSNDAAKQKLVSGALKDKCTEYRNAALAHLSANDAPAIAKKIKGDADTKADVLNWLGNQRNEATLAKILPNISNKDTEVAASAMWAAKKIGGQKALLAIAQQLKSSKPEIVEEAKNCLLTFNGNINEPVAAVIPQAGNAGKIAALELLSARRATAQAATVFEAVNAQDAAVKAAAYAALKNVVSENDLANLYNLLESADAANVTSVQDAVVAALSSQPQDKQLAAIKSQMAKAGDKQYLYYNVLASTKQPKALQEVVAGFKSGKGAAKEAAFVALLNWPDFSVAEELYQIAVDANSSAYAEKAVDAYINKIASSGLNGAERLIFLRDAFAVSKNVAQKKRIVKEIENTGEYLGLLFAGQLLDDKDLQQEACSAVKNIALRNKQYNGENVRVLLNKVINTISGQDSDYAKQEVRNLLAELPADEPGFVSIFNGKDLSGWKGLVANPIQRAKMTPKELADAQKAADLMAVQNWKVENGAITYFGHGGDNLCTNKQYGDFEMYVDWLLYPGKEADAGVYLRGTPQVQIWDTARVNVGAQVGSGGLYNNRTNRSTPLKVADNKMGKWNSFYIKMIGERVTVYLNGELIVDNVILENFWDRSQPIFPIEQLELQAHGSKVAFRDIYVKEIPRKEPYQLSAQEKKEGFKLLFDGTTMHNFVGNKTGYVVEDGNIVVKSAAYGSNGNLYTKDEYGDFIYRFDFQLTPAANNGLGIRTPLEGDAAYVGMELQILDNDAPVYKDLKPYQFHGSVYGIIPSKKEAMKPIGEWNSQEVIAKGDNIKVILNGVVILDGNIRQATNGDSSAKGTPDHRDHPGLFNKKGHIGFLGHGSEVKFRNIRVKELK